MKFRFKDYTTEQLKKMRFFVPLNGYDIITPFGFGIVSGNPRDSVPVECAFVEGHYKLEDHYKCEVEPVDERLKMLFPREKYYQCDFESLIEEDIIAIKTDDSQHVEPLTWREQLTPGCYIEHTGWVIRSN